VAAAQAPTGFGLVSPDQRSLTVAAGDSLEIKFAAAEGVEAVEPPEADAGDLTQAVVDTEEPEADNNDDLLQLVGIGMFGLAGLTLLGGIGAALLLRRR
jgi:hypothetical protein